MRWFDSPPCVPLDVIEATDDRLLLRGPTVGARAVGGFNAAMGGVAAAVGLRLLRLPLPGPMKLVPLGFAAVGGVMAAVGASRAVSQVSVEVTTHGLDFRWRPGPLPERALHVDSAQLAALEVKTHVHSERSSRFGEGSEVYEYRLVAITKDGRVLAIDTHGTHAQAELRKQAIEARLRRAQTSGPE